MVWAKTPLTRRLHLLQNEKITVWANIHPIRRCNLLLILRGKEFTVWAKILLGQAITSVANSSGSDEHEDLKASASTKCNEDVQNKSQILGTGTVQQQEGGSLSGSEGCFSAAFAECAPSGTRMLQKASNLISRVPQEWEVADTSSACVGVDSQVESKTSSVAFSNYVPSLSGSAVRRQGSVSKTCTRDNSSSGFF